MFDLLSKFEEVEVTKEFFTSEDYLYCEKEEANYLIALKALQNALETLESIQRTKPYKHSLSCSIDQIKHSIIEIKETFQENIYEYFEKTYQVTLTIGKGEDLQSILGEIQAQLDGLTFEEKANDQLLVQLEQSVRRKENFQHKNMTITLLNFIDWNQWLDGYRLTFQDRKLEPLLKAMASFENEDYNLRFAAIYERFNHEIGQNKLDMIEIDGTHIKGIKVYKNRRVDIKFHSYDQAREFGEVYFKSFL